MYIHFWVKKFKKEIFKSQFRRLEEAFWISLWFVKGKQYRWSAVDTEFIQMLLESKKKRISGFTLSKTLVNRMKKMEPEENWNFFLLVLLRTSSNLVILKSGMKLKRNLFLIKEPRFSFS